MQNQNLSTEGIRWELDANHSELNFKVRHMMISHVKGGFDRFEIGIDGHDLLKSRIHVRVDADSINTGNADRDAHLRSGDFLDTSAYPTITFESEAIEQNPDGTMQLKGLLNIKGITHPVELNVEYGGTNVDPWGNLKAGFSIQGKLKRPDWGLTWNAALEAGGVLVSDEVSVSGDLQFVRR